MKWFKNVTTIEELRKVYRKLLKEYHPDCTNGNAEITKEINAEYDFLFDKLKTSTNSTNKTTDKNNEDENKAFKEILNTIIYFDMDIEIIGEWIWCFNCYSYKDTLKAMEFKYAPKKKAWCWHYGNYKKYGTNIGLDELRIKYGYQKVNNKQNKNLLC